MNAPNFKINIIKDEERTSENAAGISDNITPSIAPSLTPSVTPSMTPSQQMDSESSNVRVKWEDLGLPEHLRGRFDELDVDRSGTLEISEIAELINKYDVDLAKLAEDHQEIKRDRQIISRQHIVILKNQNKLDEQQNAHEKLLIQMDAAQKDRMKLLDKMQQAEKDCEDLYQKVEKADNQAQQGQRKLMVAYFLLTCLGGFLLGLFIHYSREVDADSDGTLKTVDGAVAKTANTDFSVEIGDKLGGPVLTSRSTGEALKTQGLSRSFNLTEISTEEGGRRLQEFSTSLSRKLSDDPGELLNVDIDCEGLMAAAAACKYNGEACLGQTPCETDYCGIYVIDHQTEHMIFPSGTCKPGDTEFQCYEDLTNTACGPNAEASVSLKLRVSQTQVFPDGNVAQLNVICEGQCAIFHQNSGSPRQLSSPNLKIHRVPTQRRRMSKPCA